MENVESEFRFFKQIVEALISEMKVAQDVDKIPDVSPDPSNENNNDVKEVRIFSVNVHMEYINYDISKSTTRAT